MKTHYLNFVSAKVSLCGEVCRDDVCKSMGVGIAHATNIFREYRIQNPGTLEYCVQKRRWKLADPSKVPMSAIEAFEYLNAVDIVFGLNAQEQERSEERAESPGSAGCQEGSI